MGYGAPGFSIGINVPSYPNLMRVPGYRVYYALAVDSNYFFYDGMYWAFREDTTGTQAIGTTGRGMT